MRKSSLASHSNRISMSPLIIRDLRIVIHGIRVNIFDLLLFVIQELIILLLLLSLIIFFYEVHNQTSGLQFFILFKLSLDIPSFELSRLILGTYVDVYFDRASIFSFQAESIHYFVEIILIDIWSSYQFFKFGNSDRTANEERVDFGIKGCTWSPCFYFQLMIAILEWQLHETVSFNPVSVPTISRIDL